jgi:hypothetical protein
MSAIKEKVAERATQEKVGYVAIYRTGDFGGRALLDGNDNLIYEDERECRDDCECDDNFVAIAKVVWVELT